MVQPGSVSAPEGGMSGNSPCRDGDGQRGHWDRQWLGSSTSPEPWVTSPGTAANLSKSALALPVPHGRQKEPGEKLQRPGNGGAEPAPASPQLCLSPSITGPCPPGNVRKGTTLFSGGFWGRGAAWSRKPGG